MHAEKTEGIVIRQADFSESSRVVTFFTRDFGKIPVIAKGAKRLKGPFDAALDLLTASQIVFLRKSSEALSILTECRLVSRFRPPGKDLFRLYAGYYLAELLDRLSEEFDPHVSLYHVAELTLQRLADASVEPQQSLLQFELSILREIGQLPAFDACLACGEPVEASHTYSFWVHQGGLICNDCRRPEYEQSSLTYETILLLDQLSQPEEDEELDPRLTDMPQLLATTEQIHEMRRLTVAAICHILGHAPKSLRFLKGFSR